MFTSRAEYRILLRQDNADVRLTPYALCYGLASAERKARFQRKKEDIARLIHFCREFRLKADRINPFLSAIGTSPLSGGCKLIDLINRPQVTLHNLAEEIGDLQALIEAMGIDREETVEAAEIEMKYAGYIARERALAEKMQRLEDIKIRGHFTYNDITQLSTEARQKLTSINPETLAQASRIPGVSPSDISVLLVLMGR